MHPLRRLMTYGQSYWMDNLSTARTQRPIRRVMHDLARLGIRFDCVTWQLQNDGIQKFMDAFGALMHILEMKGKEKAIVYA